MLRDRQQPRKGAGTRFGPASGSSSRWAVTGRNADIRVPVLFELIDSLDLESFVGDPAYRRRLNEVLDTFSDEEFDHFERLYTRRFTLN